VTTPTTAGQPDVSALLRAGKLDDAVAAVQTAVRSAPADPRHRIALYQLYAVLGRWQKAADQLEVAAELDKSQIMFSTLGRSLCAAELHRAEVFAGTHAPTIFGEPPDWIGPMIQAARFTAESRHDAAAKLRALALEMAPAVAGNIDGRPFAWIADADPRLGPLLEAFVDGKYFWVPFERLRRLSIRLPTDLDDSVWLRATFVWSTGGESMGHVPVRYPGSPEAADPLLRLARATAWSDVGGAQFGLGQRTLATDADDVAIMEVREITITESPDDSAPGAAQDAGRG